MKRIKLMKSMIALNEQMQSRKLGFFEKAYGVILMSLQSTKTLSQNEFKLKAYVINMPKNGRQ